MCAPSMTTRRSLLGLAALVFARGCAPVTTAPPPVTPATSVRTAYARDTPALIASPAWAALSAERLAGATAHRGRPLSTRAAAVDAHG